MRLALISAGLFLASYLAVNRGFGPNPLQLIVPLVVAVGTAVGARWLMRRGRGESARVPERSLPDDAASPAPQAPTPRGSPPPSPPRPPGAKARKLF